MTANQIAYWTLQETKRSNLIKEGETRRTNLANEGIKRSQIYETTRANRAQEALKGQENVMRGNEIALKAEDLQSQKARRTNQTVTDYISAIGGVIGNVGKVISSFFQASSSK